jgi:hypothetical protein
MEAIDMEDKESLKEYMLKEYGMPFNNKSDRDN